MNSDFAEAVIELHRIAALIEKRIGVGLLSNDLRNCADRLHDLTKEITHESSM